MSSENVETTQQLVEGELPHLDDSIKNELLSPTLKHVPEPTEKIVLPNAEDIEKEKTEQALVNSIEVRISSSIRFFLTFFSILPNSETL